VAAIQALPEKEAPGREAVVGSALGILERRYGLARGRGAVVRLHARLLARPVAQPQELDAMGPQMEELDPPVEPRLYSTPKQPMAPASS
jgi:hypothetical protein